MREDERKTLDERANSLLRDITKFMDRSDRECVHHLFAQLAAPALEACRDDLSGTLSTFSVRSVFTQVLLELHPIVETAHSESITPKAWDAVYSVAKAYMSYGDNDSMRMLCHLQDAEYLVRDLRRTPSAKKPCTCPRCQKNAN